MKSKEKKRFEELYHKHLIMLENHGMRKATIDSYSRAVRRIAETWDRCPDSLTREQMRAYFNGLTKTHSWSTIKCDLSGLKFFWEYVLEKEWDWVSIVKPPQIKSLPDILTIGEVQKMINSVRKMRYRVFLFAVYSMGLRLGEGINLRVGDIDSQSMQIHIRNGKGGKDRFVTLPEVTLEALRLFWKTRGSCHAFWGLEPRVPKHFALLRIRRDTSQSRFDFPESKRNSGKHSKGRHSNGSRRAAGGHESCNQRLRDQKESQRSFA